MRIVVALGGNAFAPAGTLPSADGEARFAREALAGLESLLSEDAELLVTHGNGPQVGRLLERLDLPLDVCVAQTQGELGYLLAEALAALLERRGAGREVVSLLTRVEVDPGDPAFRRPSKPVGPWLDRPRIEALRRRGGTVGREPGRGFRRLVPSPEPLRVVEAGMVCRLLDLGAAVVAGGGGGVPVARVGRDLRGIEAVVDKDLTSALLAEAVSAELLAILTDVPCAYTDFGTPRQAPLRRAAASRALELLEEGHFAPGSMGPKIRACARFASRPGRRAVICDAHGLAAALAGVGGTTVLPDEGRTR